MRHPRRSVSLSIALALTVTLGCDDKVAKARKAQQEIALQATLLMQKATVPRDQKHFDEVTLPVGCPADPWGAPYVYERLGIRQIRISSKGPDRSPATDDDIKEEFTFPTGTGVDDFKVVRADGIEALKSPDGSATFWTVTRDEGNLQTTEYWVGDAEAKATRPVRTQTVDTDLYRRSVTLMRWSRDGKTLVVRDNDGPSRPDLQSRTVEVMIDASTGRMVAAAPSDAQWIEY